MNLKTTNGLTKVLNDGTNFGLSHYPPVRGNFVPKFKDYDRSYGKRGADIFASSNLLRSQVISGFHSTFHRTFTIGIRLGFVRLISRSMIPHLFVQEV